MTKDLKNVCVSLSLLMFAVSVISFVAVWIVHINTQDIYDRYEVIKFGNDSLPVIFDRSTGRLLAGKRNFVERKSPFLEKYGDKDN